MQTIKSISVAVVGEGAISPIKIHKAVYRFRMEYIDRPDELVVSPAARMELYRKLTERFSDPEVYQGMKILVDYRLTDDSEWMVRKTDEKWYELKEEK